MMCSFGCFRLIEAEKERNKKKSIRPMWSFANKFISLILNAHEGLVWFFFFFGIDNDVVFLYVSLLDETGFFVFLLSPRRRAETVVYRH